MKTEIKIGTRRSNYRYAGHCYSTIYTYPCIEEFTSYANGKSGGYWAKVRQYGRRGFRMGYNHGKTMQIMSGWEAEIAAHNAQLPAAIPSGEVGPFSTPTL